MMELIETGELNTEQGQHSYPADLLCYMLKIGPKEKDLLVWVAVTKGKRRGTGTTNENADSSPKAAKDYVNPRVNQGRRERLPDKECF